MTHMRLLRHTRPPALHWRGLDREDVTHEPPDRVVSDAADGVDDRFYAVAVLRSLPPKQRAVLVLRYLYDLARRRSPASSGCPAER